MFLKRSRQCLSIQATKLSPLMSSLTRRETKMSIISCFTFGQIQQCCPENKTARQLMSKVFVRQNGCEIESNDQLMCCRYLPSVKLHLSQPEEEGVLHGDTPSSASETKIKKIVFHKALLDIVVFLF